MFVIGEKIVLLAIWKEIIYVFDSSGTIPLLHFPAMPRIMSK